MGHFVRHVATLFLALLCACVQGNAVEWQKKMDEGNAAVTANAFARAEEAFAEAVRLAESLEPGDSRARLAKDELARVRWVRSMDEGMAAIKEESWARAEAPILAALGFAETVVDSADPHLETSLSALALIYDKTSNLEKQETSLRRLLQLRQRTRGAAHPNMSQTLNALGLACRQQGKYEEAAGYYEQALKLAHDSPGVHAEIGVIAYNLSIVLDYSGKTAHAEPLFRKSVEIMEASVGRDNPAIAHALYALASAQTYAKRYDEASSTFLRYIAIQEKAFGPEHESRRHPRDRPLL